MKHDKTIHVIYIITKLELGGAQKVCLALMNGLDDGIFSTSLISGSDGYLRSSIEHQKNVHLLTDFTREVSVLRIFNEIRLFIRLIQTLRSIKKNHPRVVVHTHSTKAGIIGRWAAWCAGIKTRFHTIHGYGFHEQHGWLAWTSIYLAELITSLITTHFICVSSADAKTGISLFPVFHKKHSIIRAAIDFKEFYTPAYSLAPRSIDQTFIYGSIACFKPQKNLFDLLKAFAIVHHHNPKSRLEIIGDGIQRPYLEEWIRSHKLSSVITLHGWKASVAPLMKQWDAFVLSSLWEGLPCALIEARLLHLPVISYDTGGIKDVITHGKNGLLCEKKDVISLAHNMLSVSNNQTLYQTLRSHKDNLMDFDYTNMIQEHKNLYKKTVLRT